MMLRILSSLMFLLAVPAAGHIGFENDTEVRVFSDTMRVVVRTSVPFAWSLLADQAPVRGDEAGQAAAKPLLVEAAKELMTISADGRLLTPASTDCIFDVQNDVSFILNFERPADWPVTITAKFFPRFGNLETGTIAVYDYTASRFSRNLEPVAHKVIDPNDPSLSFSLGFTKPVTKPIPPTAGKNAMPEKKVARETPEKHSKLLAGLLMIAAAVGVVWVAWRRLHLPGVME